MAAAVTTAVALAARLSPKGRAPEILRVCVWVTSLMRRC